jgi:branched-chain amino acid transport system substrate-binding protein
MRRLLCAVCALAIVTSACGIGAGSGDEPVRIGAIYPLSGSMGPGGVDEHRGVLLAADLVNADGGVDGRPLQIDTIDVAGADAAPAAIQQLDDAGVQVVLGSYGSTISAPASQATASRGMLFWETGAVGTLPMASDEGGLTFRVPPTGGTLGRNAIGFTAEQLAPAMHRDPSTLRYAVSYVDDVYGRSVAGGAEAELAALGLHSVGRFGYDLQTLDADALARRIAKSRPDVLFVSAYLEDAIALRRALVRRHVPLLASIGTSSSYCMPAFGQRLGPEAVGLYASDKPSAEALGTEGLSSSAAALLHRADAAYAARYGAGMSPAALAGFSAAWALFHDVLPAADGLTPDAIARAALAADLPQGSLPNGSGLRFGAPGGPGAGDNLAAASVVWEWVAPGQAAVVWPPRFATHPITPMDIVR